MNKFILVILTAIFFLAPFLCSAEQYNMEKIFYMSQLKEKQGIADLKKYSDKIDILAPQFYAVSAKLILTGKLDAQLKTVISQKKIKVMPLVVNAGFSQKLIHSLLLSSVAQDTVIKSLVDIAKNDKYIGWQFDFENISYLDKDLYSAFIEKTSESFKKNNLILSVAAVTRSVDYEDTNAFKNWGGAFDYARIAKSTDFISLMTYDDPDSVGPVASLPFINKVLGYVREKIPPEKLSLGIPLYNWGWSSSPFKKVAIGGTYDGLLRIESNNRHNTGFDSYLGASWLTYIFNNQQYQVWYQGKQSFENKLDVVKQNSFRGFSAWVMGVEDPEIWSTLGSNH